MAIAVEHVVGLLGATKIQLYEKFKQVWQDTQVLDLLPDNRARAVQSRLADDWPSLKIRIEALRNEPGGMIAADLVMAHRIRGGVHTILSEDDEFQLEQMFVSLMRAALFTFVETRRTNRAPE